MSALPDTPERRRQELNLQISLGHATRLVKGHGAPEANRIFARAHELAEEVGSIHERMAVHYGLWSVYQVGGRLDREFEQAQRCLDAAKNQPDPEYLVLGHRLMGATFHMMGRFAEGRDHLEHALALYRPAPRYATDFRFGQDNRTTCLAYLSHALWYLGYADQALRAGDEAIEHARTVGHDVTLALALNYATMAAILVRDLRAAEERSEEALRFSRERGFAMWSELAACLQAWIMSQRGQYVSAIEQMKTAMAAMLHSSSLYYRPVLLGLCADAHAGIGRSDTGSAWWKKGLS